MRAGFAKVELTPPLGVELTGYGYYLERRGTHVIDPLYAHALALQNDQGDLYLLFSCDVLGMNRYLIQDVHEHVQKKHGIAPEHTIFVSVHTHTGPSLKYHEGCGEICPEYVKTVPSLLMKAADEALQDLAPVSHLEFAMDAIPVPHVYNRAAKDGAVDDQVRAFFITRDEKKPIALVSYACHAVCRGHITGISADFPGACCRLMEEKGYECMYLNGLCGDIDPMACEDDQRDANLDAFAADIIRSVSGPRTELPLTAKGGWLKDQLFLQPVTKEAIHAAADKAAHADNMIPGADKVARIWEEEMIGKFDTLTESEPIHVSYLRLGGVPIIALPFEGFTKTGMLIRDELNDKRALTLGCAEELLGYLPTRDDILRGAYAALESTFLYKRLPCLPGEAERLGNTLGQMLKNA